MAGERTSFVDESYIALNWTHVRAPFLGIFAIFDKIKEKLVKNTVK